jgi:carboxypeptidase C (cathepsin A)
MNALFTENGPLRVQESEEEDFDFKVSYEPENSWQEAGDLIYVDSPVGTGWSYGEQAATSLNEIGSDFVTFLTNFY